MSKGQAINDNKILKQIEKSKNIINEIAPVDDDMTEIDLPETQPPVKFEDYTHAQPAKPQDVTNDLAFARKTMHHLIENGQTALAELLRVAMLSDHPRAFEVVSTLMKNIGDLTKDMMAIQEKALDLAKKEKELHDDGFGPKLIDGDGEIQEWDAKDVAFSGSTDELLERLEKEDKEKDNK